ncbi:hypothetical protein [Flavobacterium sp. PL002]
MIIGLYIYIYIYPQKKQFYTIYNEYYRSTLNLSQRGKIFGNGHDCCINGTVKTLKIGIWYHYDEQGNLIKETDEDKKFGKFGYNELLKFLDKEKQINLRKGVSRNSSGDARFEIIFFYSEQSDKKLWHVFVHTGLRETLITPRGEIGERAFQPGKGYYIDGNTGRVIKNFKVEKDYYKEIMN